jgi:hypothetical protein
MYARSKHLTQLKLTLHYRCFVFCPFHILYLQNEYNLLITIVTYDITIIVFVFNAILPINIV